MMLKGYGIYNNYALYCHTQSGLHLRLLPTWIQSMVTSNEQIDGSGDSAYLAYVVTREELNNIAVCQNIITNENTVHLVVRHDSNLTINVSSSQVTHIPTDNNVVCLSVELCG